eukprot:TRINITY_DN5125_c0_g1_i3.p1 TRINITY_DN5125_c0_g1~~TRINITY_DN5125_c0_g1_i3.p1  ORF type:complete len:496 (+),score=106.12 TRINITY_DN5125_c0_g1_i3:97-1584(+)
MAQVIRSRCLEHMRTGGMTPEQRLSCFEMFEDTHPDSKSLEYFYNAWGKDYDKDMEVAHYHNYIEVAKMLDALFHGTSRKKRRQLKILDVGAGTGLCGKVLHELGFDNIDAVDGSAQLLDIARRRGVYKHVYPEVLVPGEPLVSVPQESYDAVVSAGSFCPDHLQGQHVLSFIDSVKRGGKIVISSSPHSDEGVGLRKMLKKLDEELVIEIKREEYLASGLNQNDDGTLWDLEKRSSGPIHEPMSHIVDPKVDSGILDKIIRSNCLERMRAGGMTAEERVACFEKFENTKPDSASLEHFYDLWGTNYDKDVVELHYTNHMEVARRLAAVVHTKDRHNFRILDVGAGTGLCGQALHELGFNYVDAVDGSSKSLQLAKQKDVYVHLYPEVLVPGRRILSVPQEHYDAIVSSGTFHPRHLQGQHVTCFLDCLKKGGKMILSSSPHSDEGVGLRDALKELESYGVVEVKREEFLPTGLDQNEDGTLWDVIKLENIQELD